MKRDRMTATVKLRMSQDERLLLERLATLERRNLSDMTRVAIIEAAKRRGLWLEEEQKEGDACSGYSSGCGPR